MRIMFGAVICWGLFVLVAGAVVFRTAVTLTNRFLGAHSGSEVNPDEDELDEWIGYRQIKQRKEGITEPGLGKGMVCVLVLAVVGFVVGYLMRFVFEVGPFDNDSYRDSGLVLLAHLFGACLSFPLSAWALASILPTKFGRACVVLLLNYAIILAIATGVMGVIYILS